MPPHRPWRPAATERRLSLARGSSCLLIRRSARFPISLPGAERKSSRPMSLPDTQGAMLCFNNKLDVGEGSRVSRKHLLIMGGLPPAFAIASAPAGGGSLFLLGLEHSAGNSGDKAAGDQAFAVSAEIISKAGDDVTFAGGQGFQPGMRDFFCSLGIALKFLLAGNGVEFGLRRARAKSAHADSMWFHLFRQALREEQVECFCCGVSRDVGNGLKGSG